MSELEKAIEWWDATIVAPGADFRFEMIADAARRLLDLTSPENKVWLCREGDRIVDWAWGSIGLPHCWFNGPKEHNPECGFHHVLRSVEEQDHV